ncbi:MAG: endo-1,4-beta-xylanase [Fuerstiella sp.]|nr:endo-1,4-beta-xylanase [Fuerstiella sp.]
MGVIQFDVEYPDYLPRYGLNHADFVMFDGRVIASDTVLNDGRLQCHRVHPESSQLRLLYQPHENGAPVVTHTTSLRESDEIYRLEVELARGELSRLRNFHGAWTGSGLQVSTLLEELIKKSQQMFFRSSMHGATAAEAIQSLLVTRDAIGELCRLYTNQRLTFRRQRASHFPMLLGCVLRDVPLFADRFLEVFSAVTLPANWADLEPEDGRYEWDQFDALVDWATENKLFIQGGPLIDLVHDSFPKWMMSWRGDIINLQSFAADFVETVVGRYVGRIRHWEVLCGANCGGTAGLTEQQRLNLVIRTVEAARQVDGQIQMSLRVIQPWGEYLSDSGNRLTPIQFIDTLRRTGVPIAEVNLEIRFGTGALQSLPRDLLGLSQLLDHWSLLQIPLNIVLSLPTFFPEARRTSEIDTVQAQWLRQTMLMCLAKERVAGLYCGSWQDDETQVGLISEDAALHPAWQQLRDLESDCWAND